MDVDNFDFKPLTKGLGFDKKAEENHATFSSPATTPSRPVERPLERSNDRIERTPLSTPSTPPISRPSIKSDFLEKQREETAKMPSPEVFEKNFDWNTNPGKASKTIEDMLKALPPSIDSLDHPKGPRENKVYKPIGRADYNALTEINTPTAPIDSILPKDQKVDISLNNTLEKAFPKAGYRRPFFHQTVEVQPQFTPVTSSFTSAVLDGLVIAGLTALFLVSLIVVTKIDLIAVVLRTAAPMTVWAEIGAIFFGVYLLYYMCTRGFWGSTLGDWAFDMQLGLEEERVQWFYPAQVVFRMVLIAATGFVILPLISFLFKKDVAYWISGLRLYTRNY